MQQKKEVSKSVIKRFFDSTFFPYFLLFIAILAVSSASIIIIKLQERSVPSDIIAMYRTLFAGLGALLLSIKSNNIKWITKKTTIKRYYWIIAAGIMLAVHFTTWFVSLKYVSVAISTTIVDATPIFLAILGFLLFKERINIFGIIGILLAFLGGALLAFSNPKDINHSPNPLLGALLATVGAITVSIYFLIGKKILKDSPLWPYFGLVNLTSAISIMLYSLILRREFFRYDLVTYIFFILLALGPSLIGHAIYNYNLKKLPAFIVGVAILGEPIGATILAILILGQKPTLLSWLYIILILLGIFFTSVSPYIKNKRVQNTA